MAILKYIATACLTIVSSAAFASPQSDIGSYTKLAKRCAPNVNITTLTALLRHESSLDPYAINVNDDAALNAQPTNRAEAVATARKLLASGHNIDVGLGQVNSANFDRVNESLDELFTPCANLRASSQILHACYARSLPHFADKQKALQAALSCYNTGNFNDGFTNGYVDSVASNVARPIPKLLSITGAATQSKSSKPSAGSTEPTGAPRNNDRHSAIFVSNTAEPSREDKEDEGQQNKGGMFAGPNSGAPRAAETKTSHAQRAPLSGRGQGPTRLIRSRESGDAMKAPELTGEGKK